MIALTKIGKFRKTQGREGHIRIETKNEYSKIIIAKTYVFIDLEGSKVPFQISFVKDSSPLVIQIKEHTDPEKASRFINSDIYIETDRLEQIEKSPPTELENLKQLLIGYRVENINSNKIIGQISEIMDYGMHTTIRVTDENRSFEVPFHEDLIIEINQVAEILSLDLPEGLSQ